MPTTLKERREKMKKALEVQHANNRGRGFRVKMGRSIKKMQAQAVRNSVIAKVVADKAIATDPALAALSDEELAARNLAAAK